MDIQDNLPKEYMDGFNNGYVFSKLFPDFSDVVFDQNLELLRGVEDSKLDSKSGLLHGIQQATIEKENTLSNEELTELNNLREDKGIDNDLDLEHE